ncbi:MAG TPA: HEAT repeat domain-containing protein [Gemmataceae bacterium]|nr:HEAT repeat domain-containing protein [Gemmataceae bacterium]
MLRFLTIQVINARHLHLESALIERLNDLDPVVAQTAHAALVRVARGTDFGPSPDSSRRSRDRSIEKWRQWLALQESESPEKLAKDAAGKPAKAPPLDIVPFVLAHDDRPAVPPEVAKGCDELVNTNGEEQMTVLIRLRDAKGIDNTDALALAIPKLSGDIQHQARDALTQRLTRMTAATLRDKLQEDNVEVRRAAALACGRKIAKEHIPDLLQLLDDPEMDVVQSARVALAELTGEDFGPTRDADRSDRGKAVSDWRKWWKGNQGRTK